MSTPPSSVGNVWQGKPSSIPPLSAPRIREHQPYNLNDRVIFVPIAYAAFDHTYLLWSAPSVSSSNAKSSTGFVFAPYGIRERNRGIAIPIYLESSESRSERHGAYSGDWKIFVRSRGLLNSCHDSIWNRLGAVPVINGACAADAICAIPPRISTSGGE